MTLRTEYEAGATIRDLCAKYGVSSTSAMKRRLDRAGCVMRTKGRRGRAPDDPLVLRARQLHQSGLSYRRIASELGFKSVGHAYALVNRGLA